MAEILNSVRVRQHSGPLDPLGPFAVPHPDGRGVGQAPFLARGSLLNWRFRRHDFEAHGTEVIQPVRVVQHNERGLVVWLAGGTPTVDSRFAGREDVNLHDLGYAERFSPSATDRVSYRRHWHGTGVLRIVPAGMPFSVWLFWAGTGEFRSWYINLEHPHTLAGDSLFTADHVLDILVRPDGTVEEKDRDELEAAVRFGQWDDGIAAAIEAEKRFALDQMRAGHWAFDRDWTLFQPDPSWTLPPAPKL